ncbi:serine protease [Hymenobacter defluvii]|uniref:Trypsin-like peptidase domain-containing protein n=1 Tax=Hymenobacter defluvii TaxID=2054411 RepID=A0ABS3TID2_9BACT|nr:serine protease [Hymenobacter defluvii]MBO3273143.1 trypsin-like peptidase domain-containing protein [Hymenobacter defluvii]
MDFRPSDLVGILDDLLQKFDNSACLALCNEFIAWLYQSNDSFPASEAAQVMQLLRNKRQFALMLKVGDALLQTGRASHRVHRQYAQALIDEGRLTAAIAVLTDLLRNIGNDGEPAAAAARESAEARGLLGRAHKQLYINAKSSHNQQVQQHLRQAIEAYLAVYRAAPAKNDWHGINVVALTRRAERDGVTLGETIDVAQLASALLAAVMAKEEEEAATVYDFAIAAEANIALGQPAEALYWIERYVRQPQADAFELASTLRQLTEVWQLEQATGDEKLLLPILQAKLLERQGGQLELPFTTLQQQKYDELNTMGTYEKVFGADTYSTYKWYTKGAARCLAVARIGQEADRGIGTGFLVQGSDLHPILAGEILLLTNAHVLTDDPSVREALRSDEACITFEVLGRDDMYKVGELVWSSPPAQLDTTVVRFAPEDQAQLQQLLENIDPYPLAKRLPLREGSQQRVYIIGHPAGGALCLSLQDNLLLDHQEPLIHYRTPTVGGSSGSPVFNQQWELIGIHHKGGTLPKLNGQAGNYDANEGLWIQAVRSALARFFTKDGSVPLATGN